MIRWAALALASAVLASGCGSHPTPARSYEVVDNLPRTRGLGPLHLRWNERLTEHWGGAYIPVERAVAALDPAEDRVYVGSSRGRLIAMNSAGQRAYEVDAEGAIGSEIVLDSAKDELFVGTEQGLLMVLTASSGKLKWKKTAEGPVRKAPVLTDDTVYVVTEADSVVAFARDNGTVLWRYNRDAPETMSVTGHAGLLLNDGKLYTGFTDGVVVALSAGDGSVQWERDTSVDVSPDDLRAPRFVDVDTTPVIIDRELWVASFAGGLYGLSTGNGGVLWHEPKLAGISGITPAPANDRVILSSGDDGVNCVDAVSRSVLWTHAYERGDPSEAVLVGNTVLVGEENGPFMSLALDSGKEIGRIEAGNGFSARPAVAGGRGFLLSNGGTLFAFTI